MSLDVILGFAIVGRFDTEPRAAITASRLTAYPFVLTAMLVAFRSAKGTGFAERKATIRPVIRCDQRTAANPGQREDHVTKQAEEAGRN